MSAAHKIQAGMIDRLKVIPFFHKFTFRRAQSYQVMPEDLPYCGVYQLPETGTADGDPNAGEPRYKSESIIGVSVILRNIEAEELEDALDVAYDVIMVGLLQDSTFIGFPPAGQYDIEGVPRVRRQNIFGSVGSANETPTGELRLEMTFTTRYDYPPEIEDWLMLVNLQTAYPSLEDVDKVQQVHVPIQLLTEEPEETP
jgi:hypothetical protein